MSYVFDELDYISGKPILMDDGYYHIEWEHKNGEKTVTNWSVNTYEHALLCIKQIIGDNAQTERVIFRVEKYAYDRETRHYLAVFPDDEANPGRVAAVPFYFDGHGQAVFEPYGEIDIGYYYKTRLVHRFDAETPKLLKALTEYYSGKDGPVQFRVMQKLTH